MPKKKAVDGKQLIKMVQNGVEQKDIMKKFGFKNSSQLKVAYANSLMETGKVPEIKSGRGAGKKTAADKQIKVNKRGSLIVTNALIDAMGFKQGDAFQVRKTKSGISLKKTP